MSRRFINEITEQESVDEVFLLSDKQLRTNRQGNMYLQLRLTDRTGALTGMLWNVTDSIVDQFEAGDYVRIRGTTQSYNGTLQMIARHVERVALEDVDEKDFCTIDSAHIRQQTERLTNHLHGLRNRYLRALAESFLSDEKLLTLLTAAPAGVKNHHAYRGGLLDHVVSLLDVAQAIAPCYPQLDLDLLKIGIFLHDSGKVRELAFEREFSYSDEGQLIGHIVLGVEMLTEKVLETEQRLGEDFPEELVLRMKHMIVSHHGQYEFGSPTLPMTLEALALHHLDNLDARLQSAGLLLREDASGDSRWTSYQANVGRKLFKGGY
jgi:3'-5' exoribonuclease